MGNHFEEKIRSVSECSFKRGAAFQYNPIPIKTGIASIIYRPPLIQMLTNESVNLLFLFMFIFVYNLIYPN
jgi:hypothetical protein